MTAPIVDDEIRNGVCMGCGGAVLNSGEHVEPDRHVPAAATGQLWEREAARDVQVHGEPNPSGRLEAVRRGGRVTDDHVFPASKRGFIREQIERRRLDLRAARLRAEADGVR